MTSFVTSRYDRTGITVLDPNAVSDSNLTALNTNTANIVYDGSGNIISFTRGNTAYTVTYPSSTLVVVTGGYVVQTITLDAQGRVISKTVV